MTAAWGQLHIGFAKFSLSVNALVLRLTDTADFHEHVADWLTA